MDRAITVRDASFAYGQEEQEPVQVFEHLNLDIDQGSFVVVLGHNGCGKSTLAKHFNAILVPTLGEVMVYGMDTRAETDLIPIRRTVGMVFQNPDNQIVANVVEEDVAFALENLGLPTEEIRERVDAARALQLQRFEGTGTLSNGRMTPAQVQSQCQLSQECAELMQAAYEAMGLTARSYDRIRKVARTIADLEGAAEILPHHLAEAIQYRTFKIGRT